MSKKLTRQDRLIRIELARTRAALERQNVVRSLHDLRESMTPAGLWHTLVSRQGAGRSKRGQASFLSQVLNLSRRYPFLLTGASAALSTLGRGRRGWAWRLVLGSLAGWKLLQRVQQNTPDTDTRDAVTPRSPR